MKFLTVITTPKLTLTHTRRRCVIDDIADLVTVYESTIKLELTTPSILQGLKDSFYRFFSGIFLAGIQVYA